MHDKNAPVSEFDEFSHRPVPRARRPKREWRGSADRMRHFHVKFHWKRMKAIAKRAVMDYNTTVCPRMWVLLSTISASARADYGG